MSSDPLVSHAYHAWVSLWLWLKESGDRSSQDRWHQHKSLGASFTSCPNQSASASAASRICGLGWKTVEGKRPDSAKWMLPPASTCLQIKGTGWGLNHSQSHICDTSSLNTLSGRKRHFFPLFTNRVLVKIHPLWLVISQRKCGVFVWYILLLELMRKNRRLNVRFNRKNN